MFKSQQSSVNLSEERRKSEEAQTAIAQENAILAEVGRIANSTLDTEEVYELVASQIHQLLPFDRMVINLVDFENGVYEVAHTSGIVPKSRKEGVKLPLEGSFTAMVAEQRRLLNFTQEDMESKLERAVREANRSIFESGLTVSMGVPLIANDNVIGVMIFNSIDPDAFTSEHERLIDQIGRHVVSAILNAQLYDQRVKAEDAQRAIATELTALIETTNTPIIGVDLECRVNVWNQAVAALTGLSAEKVIGTPFLEHVSEDDVSSVNTEMLSTLDGSDVLDFEFALLTASNERKDLIVNCAPRRNADGDIIGAIAVALDITARKEADLEIRNLNENLEKRVEERTSQLRSAVSELESFSYSVSHDLRSPLRTIDGFSLALMQDYEDILDEDGRDFLHRIRNATQRMGNLIDDMLSLSRVGRAEMFIEPVSLTAIVSESASILRSEDSQRDVELIIQDDVVVTGDERLLGIVMDNLMRNAWKFTSRHDSARIEFGSTQVNGDTAYFVRDDGAGFDMEFVNKLFMPFQRLHGRDEFQGTGVGLATIKRIIDRHGGRVWAEAEVEKGATIYFTLNSQRQNQNA